MHNIIDQEEKIKEWEKSITKMIPKVSAAKLRPIALTDISYKMFMTLIGQKVDQHISNNSSRKKETGWFH